MLVALQFREDSAADLSHFKQYMIWKSVMARCTTVPTDLTRMAALHTNLRKNMR